MAKVMTLTGSDGGALGASRKCKCVYNPRTKRHAELCFVGKSSKNRSGWKFQKGGAQRCKR
jgi:hypothetical protein